MHPNPAFRAVQRARNLAFAAERAFGILAVNAPAGPLMAHVPFVPDAGGTAADLHLVRSNPLLAALDAPCPAVLAVSGPDGYVSPDWYGLPDQVPTWNYVAVHLRGRLERLPQDALPALLDRQSAAFEARLAPKAPWMPEKMSADVRERMMRAIVPCRLHLEEVSGTWKLNQNKDDAARLGAAKAVTGGFGQELASLAALMVRPPER